MHALFNGICCTHNLCSTDKREIIEKAFPDLAELDIYDVQTSDGDAEIDVLIGSDYYWSVVED